MKSDWGAFAVKHGVRQWMRLPLLALALFAAGTVYSQQTVDESAYLDNETGYTLYLRPSPELPYRQVPSGGILPLTEAGRYQGFGYRRGIFSLPTISVSAALVAAGQVLRVTDSDFTPGVSIDPADVADTISGPRLDNQYLDWLSVEPLFAIARGRTPLGSFVNSGTGREAVAPSQAFSWRRAGTDLEWLKTAVVGEDLFVSATAYSRFAPTTTLNLFFYGSGEYPVATVEIPLGETTGYCVLWLPTNPEPAVVGNAVSSEFFVEAQVWLDLFLSMVPEFDDVSIIEIGTASSAPGMWEEFVLARIPVERVIIK